MTKKERMLMMYIVIGLLAFSVAVKLYLLTR